MKHGIVRSTKESKANKITNKNGMSKKYIKATKSKNSKKNIKSNNSSKSQKSILDFKKEKYISVASKISDIKSSVSHIGELYDVKELHDMMNKMCADNIITKEIQEDGLRLTKKASKNICNCLFEKNKNLTINDLESRIKNKKDTPGSKCITILDNYINTHKKHNKRNAKLAK